ncbi:MAG: hypothetical protein JO320_19545 [Alphaproteobacteria bacterium]|nr:hypothetical protein [Alphaproteobacteria bacterium]MBV9377212.1 hypothetical protein [Alphaproteobacteria bacterium]
MTSEAVKNARTMPVKLLDCVTQIQSDAERRRYLSVHSAGWALRIRDFWRITPISEFPQIPGGRTKCYAVPNGKSRSLDALIEMLLASPDAKNTRGYRLYGHRLIWHRRAVRKHDCGH